MVWKPSFSGFAQAFKFGHDLWDPSHRFETSWLISPWALFAARALISLYAFADLFFVIGWQGTGHDGGSLETVRNSFSYFTVLCFWGIATYFCVAAIHTFSYALHGGTPLLNRFPRPLQALHYLFYTTIVTFPFIVTIVYWGLIYDGPYKTTYSVWANVSQHGLNSVFALFELFITRINPPPFAHLFWLVVILAGYLGLAYLTHATKGFYTYNFLNPAAPRLMADGENVGGWGTTAVVGVCFGIAIGIMVVFCVIKGLAHLRKWATEKKMGKTGKFYAGRSMGAGEVELETQRVWEK